MTTPIPGLTTQRLTLRGPGPQDADHLIAFYASDRSSFVGGPIEADLAWRQLSLEIGHWTMRGYGRWIVEETETGQQVGLVGLWNPLGWPEPEVGWDLFEGQTGKGYATEAADAARAFAYDVIGLTTLISLVAPGNTASAAVATRLGAVRDGAFSHSRLGDLQVWRHPGPDALADGGAEAYA